MAELVLLLLLTQNMSSEVKPHITKPSVGMAIVVGCIYAVEELLYTFVLYSVLYCTVLVYYFILWHSLGNQLNIMYNTRSLSDFKTEDNTYIYLYMYDRTRATYDSVNNTVKVKSCWSQRYVLVDTNSFEGMYSLQYKIMVCGGISFRLVPYT